MYTTACNDFYCARTFLFPVGDGGEQERDAATRFIKAVYPDADVKVTRVDERPIRVKISSGGKELVDVAQRDLFGKYGWPAEAEITEALKKFKAEQEEASTAAAK